MQTKPDPTRFAHVRNWIFDLDNTLYPASSNLWSQVAKRMTAYISRMLGVDEIEARKVQKDLFYEYGTTFAGLIAKHKVDPADFLRDVHDIDYSWLKKDAALNDAIGALPGRKFIFTNGDKPHAERAARQLGILEHFSDIFDIVAADLTPKPSQATFDAMLNKLDVLAADAAMFEDIARNLIVPKAGGMITVLVTPDNGYPSADWQRDEEAEKSIDFATDSLSQFLREIVGT